MNRSLETTLTGLIPTLTGPIPTELVNMAASLLALSRQRVGALKPEEESARAYLCAHIACERLRVPLDLPPVEPRPPLPKRQYNLLHTQFSNALPTAGACPPSPVKKAPPTAHRTLRTVRHGPAVKQAPTTSSDPITTFVFRVCTHQSLAPADPATSPPAATVIKHVLAATKSIGLSPPTAPVDTINTMAILSAIHILATSKLSGKEITGEVYTRQRSLLCTILEEVSSDWGCATGWTAASSTPTKSGTPTKIKIYTKKDISKAPREGPVRVKITPNDVDEVLNAFMADARAIAWLGTVPFWSPSMPPDNLPPVQTADEATEFEPWVDPDKVQPRWQRANLGGVRKNSGRGSAEHSGGAGIGRMRQDRVDYLSERKKTMYIEWKRSIMKRVEEIERGGTSGAR